MSTVKRHTSEEIEAFIAQLPHAAPETCDQLCADISNDIDILQNLEDYPANLRAKVAAAARRSLLAANQQRQRQHCPPCDN